MHISTSTKHFVVIFFQVIFLSITISFPRMYDQQHGGKKQDKTHQQSETVDINHYLISVTNLPNTGSCFMHRGEYINSTSKEENGHQSHKRQDNYSTGKKEQTFEWNKNKN